MTVTPDIAVVVIGRNEGARLVASLASLQGVVSRIVYVDSGSTDDSLQAASDAGAQVVELDLSVPFTAARARNAGFAALDPVPEFVQFIDGDCMVEPGWIASGLAALAAHDDMGIVTGWRAEVDPDASVYNGLADFEWHRPAGDIDVCGGDLIVRSKVFLEVNGFNAGLIAGEDEEFCIRVAKAGWRLHRLPEKMTKHDADMMRFGQWWQRAVRAGHAYAQVSMLHPEYSRRNRLRILVFGAILPLIALFGLTFAPWLLVPVVLLYLLSYVRTVRGLQSEGLAPDKARHQSVFLSLSKVPNLIGMLTYYWRRLRNRDMVLIEYK
ncbi:glycosyltransferase [Yoonia algicola]|uniref:Glycosyltransferase n=1 Tax=Yoonia algicola TaxID=3137368 RepID=A0AAN0M230_9RHOB